MGKAPGKNDGHAIGIAPPIEFIAEKPFPFGLAIA
jgi:hypothetical protein